jgi:hypothetical protein
MPSLSEAYRITSNGTGAHTNGHGGKNGCAPVSSFVQELNKHRQADIEVLDFKRAQQTAEGIWLEEVETLYSRGGHQPEHCSGFIAKTFMEWLFDQHFELYERRTQYGWSRYVCPRCREGSLRTLPRKARWPDYWQCKGCHQAFGHQHGKDGGDAAQMLQDVYGLSYQEALKKESALRHQYDRECRLQADSAKRTIQRH